MSVYRHADDRRMALCSGFKSVATSASGPRLPLPCPVYTQYRRTVHQAHMPQHLPSSSSSPPPPPPPHAGIGGRRTVLATTVCPMLVSSFTFECEAPDAPRYMQRGGYMHPRRAKRARPQNLYLCNTYALYSVAYVLLPCCTHRARASQWPVVAVPGLTGHALASLHRLEWAHRVTQV